MAKREKEFTTQLIASLVRAGVEDAYKIPDPPWIKGRSFGSRERPCDVIGTLPGGRSLHIEVKQARASEANNQVLGFSPKELKEHQQEHLALVDRLGGVAVVALVSWAPRSHWHLYLCPWPVFRLMTSRCTKTITAETMRTAPYIEREKPSKRGWNIETYVKAWIQHHVMRAR